MVSYVVNNGPRPVAARTRERVLQAIDELGYQPNAVARALKVRRTHTLGLLVPDNSNPYFAELAKAVEDVAYARGYALLLVNSSNDQPREASQLAALRARQVDGLLLISTGAGVDLTDARTDGPPIVLIDRLSRDLIYPSVVVDNFGGARAAVLHLIEHGHRRIACIAGPSDVPAAAERERGWRAALSTIPGSSTDLLRRTDFTRQAGYDASRALLAHQVPPTAIFASSDLQGVGVLRACYEAGLNVPDDIAVFAFDGTQESQFTAPPMSVVQQSIKEIAETAVNMLLSPPQPPEPKQIVVPYELITRRSCGC